MPGYKVHVGAGALFYAGALFIVSSMFVLNPSFFTALEWFFCCILGALFPDVDTKSKGQIIFYELVSICLLFFLWKSEIAAFIWVSLLSMVPVLVRHRGLFHKVWFVILTPFVGSLALLFCYPVNSTLLLGYSFFFAVGALSHIFFDTWGTKFGLSSH